MTGLSREPPAAPRPARDIAGLGSVVGVWAHPHDEVFLSAGLMALARAAGNRVVVVTATRGERGTTHPDRWPPERFARLRSDELAASLAVLGVAEHRFLDCPDGSCFETGQEAPMDRVRRVIEEVRPDTIVTFGPDGMTGDPDHRAVSAWTTAAWEAVGRVPALLYAAPTGIPDGLALDLRLDGPVLDRKVAALRAHATQAAGVRGSTARGAADPWWRREMFRDATSAHRLTPPHGGGPPQTSTDHAIRSTDNGPRCLSTV